MAPAAVATTKVAEIQIPPIRIQTDQYLRGLLTPHDLEGVTWRGCKKPISHARTVPRRAGGCSGTYLELRPFVELPFLCLMVLDLQPTNTAVQGHVRSASRPEPLVRELSQQMEPVRHQGIEAKVAKERGNRGMPSADEYRRHAGECVRLAQNAQNPADKALLLKMAETWLRLAEQAEGREFKKPD